VGEREAVKIRWVVAPATAIVSTLFLLTIVWSGCSTKSETTPPPTQVTSACTGSADYKAVYATYCNQLLAKTLPQITGECAVSCVLAARDKEDPKCVVDCIRDATDGGISEPCMACHDQLVACARKVCLSDCLNGPLDPRCLNCMCGDNFPDKVNCYDPHNVCSGLNLTYCKQWDAGTFDGFPPPEDVKCSD